MVRMRKKAKAEQRIEYVGPKERNYCGCAKNTDRCLGNYSRSDQRDR